MRCEKGGGEIERLVAYGVFFALLIAGMCIVRNYDRQYVNKLNKMEYPLRIFYPLAFFITDHMASYRRYRGREIVAKEKLRTLREIYVKTHVEEIARLHEAQKAAVFYVLLLLGCLSGILIEGGRIIEKEKEITELIRPEADEYSEVYDLEILGIGQGRKDIQLEVSERKLTDKEVQKMFDEIIESLDDNILGENESLLSVTSDLRLPGTFFGGTVECVWETEDETVLDSLGHIMVQEIPEEGICSSITARLCCGQYEREYKLNLRIISRTLSSEDKQMNQLIRELKKAEEMSKEEISVILPKEINGQDITYQLKEGGETKGLLPFFIIGSGILFILWKEEQLTEKVKKRKEQMFLDYSEILTKLTVLLGAGMTVRGAWNKIVIDYESMKKEGKIGYRYAYEEMLLTKNSMQDGIYESIAYAEFGRRCGLHIYLKLGSILEQNLQKGNKGLAGILKKEASEAFEERKNAARRQGEETEIKLVFPMLMMLCIVLVIIIVPAFMSF